MKYTLLALLLPLSLWAQTGPYKWSQTKANLAQRIIHVIDNSTVGAVQTVLGASHVIVFAALKPISHKRFGLSTHVGKENEVSQFVVDMNIPWFQGGSYSLGLFQVGGDYEKHEGGHSVASAALGPLYLPTVGLSYLVESHDSSFMEDWADLEADPELYLNTASGEVGLGRTVIDGTPTDILVYKFKIEQRQIIEDRKNASDKIFQWINTRIVKPLVSNPSQDKMPVLIEFDLLKKTLNFMVNNIHLYLDSDQEMRTSIQTEQRYLHIESDPVLQRIHMKALDWSAQYGLEYNLKDKLSVTPRVGLGLSQEAFSKTSRDFYEIQFKDSYTWTQSLSLLASLEIKVMDYATIKTQWKKEWNLSGMVNTTLSTQLGNEFRNPFKKRGAAQFIDVSGGYQYSKWDLPGQSFNWSQWNMTLGLRF